MNKTLALRLAAIPAFVLATAVPAMAAVSADVTTALSDMKADGLTIGAAVLVAIIAFAAFKLLRRVV
jgi:hypothetical protein